MNERQSSPAPQGIESITVDVWISELDGVPVVQIDVPEGAGRFRVNINDGPIWDQEAEQPYFHPDSRA